MRNERGLSFFSFSLPLSISFSLSFFFSFPLPMVAYFAARQIGDVAKFLLAEREERKKERERRIVYVANARFMGRNDVAAGKNIYFVKASRPRRRAG